MSTLRPTVLALAGFDPSSGAGITADVRTIEQLKAYPLGVLTANTIQTEHHFITIRWEQEDYVVQQLEVLLKNYTVSIVKIGIVRDLITLKKYISCIKQYSSHSLILWDPVISASTGFDFSDFSCQDTLAEILQQLDLITPNYLEIHQLVHTSEDAIQKAQSLSIYCDVLLKGGHNPNAIGFDYYIKEKEIYTLSDYPKHGSGCVLSSAISVYLAKGYDKLEAIKKAKKYIELFLNSNYTLLGYHG